MRRNNVRVISKQPKPRRRRNNNKVWLWRIGLGSLLLILVLALCGAFHAYFGSPTLRTAFGAWRSGEWKPEKAFPGRSHIDLLILGKDVDIDNRKQVMDTRGRTDAILLARLDFENKTASILSIPRDTIVKIPGYRGKHKVNSAHAYGGPELACRTIENFLSVEPDHYVVFNYDSFEKAVDMVGGLTVNVPKKMDYDDNWGDLHIHLNPGVQTLNGDQTLGFARYRKSNDGESDSDQERILRQQRLLFAAKHKLISVSTFRHLPNVIETVRGGVDSTMTDSQMMAVTSFIKSLPSESVTMATIPGDVGRSFIRADEAATRDLVNKMF